MYVMTSDYGAASQLEKIDMLDFADFIALNKFEKRGAEDALRDVRKQVARNRKLFKTPPEQLPVYPTIASQFNDAGVNTLFAALCAKLARAMGPPEALAAAGTRAARPAASPGDHPGRARALPRGNRRGRARGAPGGARGRGGREPRARPASRAGSGAAIPRCRAHSTAIRRRRCAMPTAQSGSCGANTTRRSTPSAPRASRC